MYPSDFITRPSQVRFECAHLLAQSIPSSAVGVALEQADLN